MPHAPRHVVCLAGAERTVYVWRHQRNSNTIGCSLSQRMQLIKNLNP